MAETKTCPKCGAELPTDAPAGICPKCLMLAGLDSERDVGSEPKEMEPTTLTSGFVPPDPEELAKHFPQLEILELLGQGGMGAVYKARQKSLERLIALKIIRPDTAGDPGFAERFSREAKALARLSHPSIVTVYDFGESDGLYYLVMEYVDGVNLRQAMQAGPLEAGETLQIVPHICDALQYAHDEGIVHRDIKPENILIDKKGRVKIADFGLAKLVGGETTDPTLTGTRQVMGTIRYMAPEQMRSSRNVDHRADIYSLGVVFYEMLTGETPLGHFEPPSKKAKIDARLDEVVLRALASEPERRFQQAGEMKSSVEQITSHPHAEVPLPVRGASSEQSVGVSTIFEREAVNLRNWFAPESGKTAEQHPTLPAVLMILLSIAGCLMILLPWMDFETDKVTTIIGGTKTTIQQPVARTRTIVGSDNWAGNSAALAFGGLALLLLVTPSTQRLTATRAGVMTAIAAFALLLTFLFSPDSTVFHPIDNLITYREGFYGSLGLSLVLLVLSATGVRHAIVWRAENRKERKQTADPNQPRFSRRAIVGACWAALFFMLLLVAVPFWLAASPMNETGPSDTPGTVGDFMLPGLMALPVLLAPFGTTILGMIALGDIRRSKGRLTGLGLAFFDAVCFPILLLDVLILLVSTGIMHLLHVRGGDLAMACLILGVPLVLLVNVVLIRRCWRGVIEPVDTAAHPDKPADTSAPLTSVKFSIPETLEIKPQVVFHFTDLGYRLVEERANEWIFLRGKKWAGLWLTDISNCHTTLTVRAVAQPQGGLRVSCAWVVKFYGGLVFRRDIAKLEAEGHELKALLRGESDAPLSEVAPGADSVAIDVESIASEPRGVPQQTQPQGLVQAESSGEQTAALANGGRGVPASDASSVESSERTDLIRKQLNDPSIGLMIAAMINWLCLPLWVAMALHAMSNNPWMSGGRIQMLGGNDEYVMTWLFLSAVVGIPVFFAALKMRQLEAYRLSILGTVLAALPITPGAIIGLPMGVWALAILTKRDVKAAFASTRNENGNASSKGADDVEGRRAVLSREESPVPVSAGNAGQLERTRRPRRSRGLLVPILIGLAALLLFIVFGGVVVYLLFGSAKEMGVGGSNTPRKGISVLRFVSVGDPSAPHYIFTHSQFSEKFCTNLTDAVRRRLTQSSPRLLFKPSSNRYGMVVTDQQALDAGRALRSENVLWGLLHCEDSQGNVIPQDLSGTQTAWLVLNVKLVDVETGFLLLDAVFREKPPRTAEERQAYREKIAEQIAKHVTNKLGFS